MEIGKEEGLLLQITKFEENIEEKLTWKDVARRATLAGTGSKWLLDERYNIALSARRQKSVTGY